ncbi:1126_t:CDS:2 [Gigaspora margarita]|uniref:1126_t:CDS:1 n=1 Tax=Gigaspora margarita TaxID=4874 RepID=A0ABN7VAQ8_GIGMA|nr:1126_t:CDS:2 [Gigaspora margarita]
MVPFISAQKWTFLIDSGSQSEQLQKGKETILELNKKIQEQAEEKEVSVLNISFRKNKIIMPSSAIKRYKFEKEIFNILSCICAVCHRIRYLPDGRGPNIIGAFTKTVILVQCKYHKRRRIGLESVQKLERLLSNFPKDTIGILVASSKNKFNYGAIERVRTSELNIILTDKKHLCTDLVHFSTNHRKGCFIDSAVENYQDLYDEKIFGQS